MPTLLDACNEVLLMVGEREVSNFTTPIGKKVRLAYRRAQSFVGVLHAWRHLRSTTQVVLSSWVNDVATLPPFLTVYTASYNGYEIRSINPETLKYKARVAPATGVPQYFSVVGEDQVQLYPQPSATDKPLIRFSLLLKPTIASAPTDVLQGPDMYNDLVTLYAQVIMHRTHTTDLNAAEATAREFETSIHMYRTSEVLQPISYL